ncbi:hypothetical protein DUNSADRAFT_6971, partial [Dunaliella salina]
MDPMLVPHLEEAELLSLQDKRVCVTGAGGYVATHIVARLLQAGSEVHATVQTQSSAQHLLALPHAAPRLKIFEADLLKPGSFDDAISRCSAVIHTASPYQVSLPRGKEKEAVVDPAILESRKTTVTAKEKESLHRPASMCIEGRSLPPPLLQVGLIRMSVDATMSSQAAAEKEAYAFHEQCSHEQNWKWRLVSILPGAIYGPPLSARADGESVRQIARMLK